jgi:hypothetical protein
VFGSRLEGGPSISSADRSATAVPFRELSRDRPTSGFDNCSNQVGVVGWKSPPELSNSEGLIRMPKAGLEPARLAAPPPQDGVSANSTTSARLIRSLTSFPAWARSARLVPVAGLGPVLVAAGPEPVVVAAVAGSAVWRLREPPMNRRDARSKSSVRAM